MATVRGLAPELLEPWVRDVFFNKYTRIPPEYTKLLKIESSSKAFEDWFKVAGLGTFVLKPEGTPVSYDDPVQGTRQRVTHSTYALGFRVTEEMMDDDQQGIISKMPSDLSDSARDHQETLAWSPFNEAFSATNFTTPDGLELCSTAHVELKTGATASNELNPGVALSHTAIEDLLSQIRLTQNDQGRPIKLNPKWLLIHPDDEWEAARLMDSEKETGTANNEINAISKSRTGLSTFVARYLDDNDAFWIVSSEHEVTWYNRKTLAFDEAKDSATKDRMFDARYRASVVPRDWFGVNGSTV